MKLMVIGSESGKEISATISEPRTNIDAFFNDLEFSNEHVCKHIDHMAVSADVKTLLHSFSKVTIKAGKVILKVGRKIIDIIFSTLKAFPGVTFGVVFGLIVGALIATVPVIGTAFSAIVTPIVVALGIMFGAKSDLDAGLSKRIEVILSDFEPLRA